MILELYIKNIAIIGELRVRFGDGFNVLSGETGAGKSIIVDSMNLILGSRGDRELIKFGEQSAYVEAQFSCEPDQKELLEAMQEYGIEPEEELIISRELSASGKNICRIGGRLVSLSVLREVASHLVNIYGQNQQQQLLDDKSHLALIDAFADEEAAQLREQVAVAFTQYAQTRAKLSSLQKDAAEKARMLDLLKYQIDEIERASLKNGEEEELSAEKTKMLHAEKIAQNLNEAKDALSGAEGAVSQLYAAIHALQAIASLDERYEKLAAGLNDAYYAVEEASYDIGALAEDVLFDEGRLAVLEERLAAISSLKRKYGGSIEEILAFLENAQQDYEELEHSEIRMAELEKQLESEESTLALLCDRLSAQRKASGQKLAAQIAQELGDLGMKGAQIACDFRKKDYSANGCDEVSLMVSLNPGQPLRHLSKVASGGEVSRIMLAIKSIVARREAIGTMIFDEIDTGISGRMAQMVAQKIAKISSARQVICVTHLAQLAAMGDRNFFIEKVQQDGQTYTTLRQLQGDEVAEEIARLSGGIHSEAAIAHGRELLANAKEIKKQIL